MKLSLTLILITLTANIGWAGAGVRGGEVVYINGKYINRDFLDSNKSCWVSGLKVEQNYPAIKKIFDATATVDWVFAMMLEKHLHKLNFCFGGPLKPIEIDSRQSIRAKIPRVDYPGVTSIFVALQNEKGQVLEDANLLEKIEDYELPKDIAQGMHFIHEIMHTFLPSTVSDDTRRESVFNMVEVVKEIYLKRLVSREELYENMKEGGFNFPLTGSSLDPYRLQVEFLLGDATQKSKAFGQMSEPDILLSNSPTSLAQFVIDPKDKHALENPLAELSSYVEAIIQTGSSNQIDFIFNKQRFSVVDLNAIAFGIYLNLPEDQKQRLAHSINIEAEISKILEIIKTANAEVHENGLIYPNKELQSFSSSDVHKSIRALAIGIKLLVDRDDWATLNSIIAQSPNFYDALTLTAAKQGVRVATNIVPREKTYALTAIDKIQEALVQSFTEYLRGVLTPQDFKKVLSIINWSRLGYGEKNVY
jgi:hypothetical protein